MNNFNTIDIDSYIVNSLEQNISKIKIKIITKVIKNNKIKNKKIKIINESPLIINVTPINLFNDNHIGDQIYNQNYNIINDNEDPK
jgi:hypothetical protein